MTPIFNYLKETRRELEHVSWPTQHQTIVYTILVALLSVGVAVYLAVFDLLFTSGLARVVNNTVIAPTTQTVEQTATTTPSEATSSEPNFTITPTASSTN